MNSDHLIEDIRHKVDIVDLVRMYTELRPAGRNYKGLCPFHKEKSPSFMVSVEKQIAYCFGCQKGGDIFAFTMEAERVDFPEALRILAEKAHVDIPQHLTTGPKKSEKETMLAVMKRATAWYKDACTVSVTAQNYIQQRGILPEIADQFRIGYASEKEDGLMSTLLQEGYEMELLKKVGLIVQQDNRYRDKFRNRLLFPITNTQGDVVGFGGRTLINADPKYLNSPETPLYHKSNVLFGLSYAKESIKEHNAVIIVEGYMDMISCFQKGYKNVVAVSGTAFTEEQIALLKRFTQNLIFCFDEDSAGWNATKKNALLCIEKDLHPKVLSLSSYGVKDLDELFLMHPDTPLHEQTTSAALFYDVLLDKIRKTGLGTIELKRRAVQETVPFLKHMHSAVEREHFLKKTASMLSVSTESMMQEVKKMKVLKKQELVSAPLREQVQKELFASPESVLVAIFLHFPEVFQKLLPFLLMGSLDGEVQNSVYKLLKNEYTFEAKLPTREALIQLLPSEIARQIMPLLLYAEDQGILLSMEIAEKIAREKVKLLLNKEKNRLLNTLKKAQEEKDPQMWKVTFQHLTSIQSLAL